MNISKIDQKKYPNLTQYVRHALPKIKGIPKISNALLKNGEIKKKSLTAIMTWGTSPMLKVVTMPKNQCGEFTPNSKSMEIRISRALVEKIEKSGGAKKITVLLGA